MIGFVVFGLFVGAVARVVVPGRHRLGCLGTLALGLVGSVVGGLVANALGTGDILELNTIGALVAIATAAVALVAVASVAAAVEDESARRFTSGRSHLASITTDVFREHPFVGVGLGAQQAAARDIVGPEAPLRRYTSHTTPLTVAAELRLAGLAAYAALLLGAAFAIRRVWQRDAVHALSLGAVLLALFVPSLFYSGFYEDQITWLALALPAAFLVSHPARPEPAR